MDYARKIQCTQCRQRLEPKSKEVNVICPGCAFESTVKNSSKKYEGRVCDGRDHSSPWPIKMINKFLKLPDSTPKRAFNTVFVRPPLDSSDSRPTKRAVLCGITYNKRKYKLKGTINDVKNMRNMLVENFGFQENGIVELTEEETSQLIPTKKNIETALKWLVRDCKWGDSLVFYFSGHGLRQPDFDGDETDGFDETICPLDFMKEGMIIDNDINSIIVKPLVKGVRLHGIIDACSSRTILDLKHKYNRAKKTWDDNIPPTTPSEKKATSGGLAICISACADDQVASDTTAFTGNQMNGAMTYLLTKFVREFPGSTYGHLLDLIHEAFEEVNKNECLINNTPFLRRFCKGSLSQLQKPQLASSEQFDADGMRFTL